MVKAGVSVGVGAGVLVGWVTVGALIEAGVWLLGRVVGVGPPPQAEANKTRSNPCLAAAEQPPLLVDVDPQANATTGIGLDTRPIKHHVYHLLLDEVEGKDVLLPTALPALHAIPSRRELLGAEVEMVEMPASEHRLRRALEPLASRYAFILIDCPPSLGFLTLNALVAANSVLVPLQCEYYAIEGLGQILETVRLCQQSLNPHLEVEGILLTMIDGRVNLAGQVAAEVRPHFGERVSGPSFQGTFG